MKDMKLRSNIISKILNILLNVFLVIFGIILLVSIYTGVQTKILKNKYSDFFGYSIFEVQTGSMAETINVGDWIVVKLTKNIKLDDIITYESNGEYVTHRVIELRKGTYITKGDANTTKDSPVDQSKVVGKVVKILPNLGFFRKTLFNKSVLIAIIVTLFFFNLAFKKPKSKTEVKEKEEIKVKVLDNKKLKEITAFLKPLMEKIVVLCKKFIKVSIRVIRKLIKKIRKLLAKKMKPVVEEKIVKETPIEENNVPNSSINIDDYQYVDDESDYIDIQSNDVTTDLDKTSIFRIISVDSDETKEQQLKVINEHKKNKEAKEALVDFIEVDSKFVNTTDEEVLEEELGKTSIYRVISIDEDDVDEKYKKLLEEAEKASEEDQTRFIAVDSDEVNDTLVEIVQNKIKENSQGTLQENKIEVKVEEPIEEEQDSSLTDINLSLLKDKIGLKKGKTIIDTMMILKSEELTEIISIITEDSKINNKKYNEKFIEAYNDAKYYNMLKDEVSPNTSQITRIKKSIENAGIEIKSDKKFAAKDTPLLENYINMMLVVANLEKANLMVSDIKVKEEFYKNELLKLEKRFTILKKEDKVRRIMRVQRETRQMLELFLNELNTNMFELKFNPLKNVKNMFGLELLHNLSFSKVYSDYIIDKTYSEGVVAEDKLYILLNLLLVRLVNDMFTDDFNRKYLLYFPKTLFSKSKKFERILKIFDNKYSKENIYILIDYSSLIKGNSIIKKARRQGYKFALIFDKNCLLLKKDRGDIYVFDYVFVDKQDERLNEILDFVPEDFSNNIIYEDITDKVGDCRGEE